MITIARTLACATMLCGVLGACNTTYDTPRLIPPSAESQTQGNDIRRAEIRLQLGISYFQQDQFATALKELNSAIALDPNLSDAYAVRALVYMQTSENELAEQDFQRVTRLVPGSMDNINNYAWFLCQTGRARQAMEMFDRVIRDRSYTQPVKALNNAGLCSLKLKDGALAEAYFSQAVRLDPNNPTTNLNLSRINYKRQDWTRAQFYINRLIKAESYSPEVLWLAIRVSHQLNDQLAVTSLVTQLHRRYPDSEEDVLSQHGAFNE